MQQIKGIRFHSNYGQMYCGIFFYSFLFVYLVMMNGNGLGQPVGWGGKLLGFSWGTLLHTLLAVTIVVFVICSVIKAKVIIGKAGIYLPKIDLLIPWEEIKGTSHIVVGNAEFARGRFLIHNARTLIIHQKEHNPVCVSFTSVITLVAVELYAPGITTNLLPAILVEFYRIVCNAFFLWFIYMLSFSINISLSSMFVLVSMWAILIFAIPLVSVHIENKHWDSHLKV